MGRFLPGWPENILHCVDNPFVADEIAERRANFPHRIAPPDCEEPAHVAFVEAEAIVGREVLQSETGFEKTEPLFKRLRPYTPSSSRKGSNLPSAAAPVSGPSTVAHWPRYRTQPPSVSRGASSG